MISPGLQGEWSSFSVWKDWGTCYTSTQVAVSRRRVHVDIACLCLMRRVTPVWLGACKAVCNAVYQRRWCQLTEALRVENETVGKPWGDHFTQSCWPFPLLQRTGTGKHKRQIHSVLSCMAPHPPSKGCTSFPISTCSRLPCKAYDLYLSWQILCWRQKEPKTRLQKSGNILGLANQEQVHTWLSQPEAGKDL